MTAMAPLDPAALKPAMNIKLVNDASGLDDLKKFCEGTDTFCVDVETNVAEAHTGRRVRTIQIGNRDSQYVIDLLQFAGSPEALVSGQGNCATSSWAQPVMDAIAPALASKDHLKVGFNMVFEYISFKWCFGVRICGLYDCYLAEKVLHCGAVPFFQDGFWGMDDMFARYVGKKLSKDLQKSFNLESPLTADQIMYAALDCRLPLPIMIGQRKKLDAANLMQTVQLENDAVPAFGDMHVSGFYLDSKEWMVVVEDIKKKHAENLKALDNHFKPVVGDIYNPPVDVATLALYEADWRNEQNREVRAQNRKTYQAAAKQVSEWKKHVEACEGEALINYGSPIQLSTALAKLGLGKKKLPTTNDKVLAKLAEEYPVIKALQEYRDTAKKLSTYGVEFLNNINNVTNRIHSDFNQIGAETGRASSTKPNLFNIPRGSAYRSCFKARPGYKLVTVDMSGAELRVIAEASGDPVWVEAFNKGWDVHSVCAEMMYGKKWKDAALENCAYYANHQKCKCPVHKELRNGVKAVNFGVAYGMEESALAGRLLVKVTEARKLLADWAKAFSVVAKYLNDSGNGVKACLEARTLCNRRRLFKRPDWQRCRELALERYKKEGKDPAKETSRIYHAMFAGIEREGKNTPIQGTNADIAKVAMGCGVEPDGFEYMWNVLEKRFGAFLVNFVYDEFVVECPEQNAKDCEDYIGECIKRAGARFLKKVVMEYEGCVDDKWSK